MMYHIISKGEIMSKSEELKKELEVLTSRRDRMQQNLYEVEKRINEIVNQLKKQ
jgi:prefoldin subunit 5